ncbi:hemin uptake protein HemP [Marinicella sp. W31]|uniref:hemin uptake protein HemP n=1 Tax=Marinicella sp. W31 TaxID=3023713 RepID=UPI0037571502
MLQAQEKQKISVSKPLVLDSKALFKVAKTVLIRHGSEHYTLRLTKNDKVILTK